MKFILSTLLLSLLVFQANASLNWTTYDIPMTDNMSLEGDVYLPDNWTDGPVILIQTPYNKNLYHFFGLPVGIGYAQEDMGYAIVIVDWRGFYGSTDALYAGAPTRGEDGYDVVEWISTQTWCNGKVGTWGPSALGKVQFQTAQQHPPHLICIVPQVAAPTYTYLEFYNNGAARTEYLEQLDVLGFGTSPIIYAHPEKDFAWDFAEDANDYPDEIQVPTFMMGGWYDHNVETMIPTFHDLQTLSPVDVQSKHRLLMGPWVHGGSGNATVGSATQGQLDYPEAVGWSDSKAWEFFDYYLKDIANGWDATPAVTYFQMGDNEWLTSDSWPVTTTNPVKLFFHENGSLLTNIPAASGEIPMVYDPLNPSPTVGGPTLRTDLDQGPYDQAPVVEADAGVVIMSSDVLTADVVVKGSVKVQITLSTDVSDTDVAVRLCDVYPDGRSMLVCDGIYRMRFVNGFTPADVISLTPGENYQVVIDMPNTALTFKAGHRIRVDVSGSNYPRFNRNMNTGGEMYPDLNGDTLVNPLIAHDLIMTSTTSTNGSFVVLPIEGQFPTLLTESKEELDWNIYPNPAVNVLNYQLPNSFTGKSDLEIFTSTGQLLKAEKVSGSFGQVDISLLSAGRYELRLTNGDDHVSREFVVEK